MEFKDCFPKSHRPEISELKIFWSEEIFDCFRFFSEEILKCYDLRFGIPLWTEKSGWTYRIGKSGVYLFRGITVNKNGFEIDGMTISSMDQMDDLLYYINDVYIKKEKEFLEHIATKNAKQKEITAKRIAREREEQKLLEEKIVPEKYNKLRWPDKLNINRLRMLYQRDSKGIYDEELADDIGITLYLRCKYGKEDMEGALYYKMP